MTTDTLADRVRLWLSLDTDPQSKAVIESLLREGEAGRAELDQRMFKDISFGTAGLRAAMGPGFSRMNAITVQLATQGVAEYVQSLGNASTIVVGCDHRHNSAQFKDITIRTLRRAGFQIRSFSSVVATPLVPFAVGKYGAAFGIMITASHNPAADNGYKVYGASACQIAAPVDGLIAGRIRAQNYQLWDLDGVTADYQDILGDAMAAYTQTQLDHLFNPISTQCRMTEIPKIVYTPMHGVGLAPVDQLIAAAGLPALLSVPLQSQPDPSFATVRFPNPEEGICALKEALLYAEHTDAKLVFANDPDADRFNFAECEAGTWRIFTGNEIAAIFADFLWQHRQAIAPNATAFVMVNSCVSSKLLRAMGQQEGFEVVETLTGFKYIAGAAQTMQNKGKRVLFAYEEAIGFMCNPDVWEKDGISSVLLAYLIAIDNAAKGQSFADRLISIYKRYAYFCQYNSYFRCEPASRSTAIFDAIRGGLPGNAADLTGPCSISLDCGTTISAIKDYPGTSMITFYLDDTGLSWVTLRASGTEPKIKFYSEMPCPYGEREAALHKLHVSVAELCDKFLEPTRNDLHLKSP